MNDKYTVIAKNNNNYIISSSEDKFVGVPIGSFIKINGCNVLHTIVNKENIIYKKKFTTDSLKHICINEPMDFCFQKGDVIKINYETLEAKFISKIISPGNGYYAGDFATVLDGVSDFNISTGQNQQCSILIKEIEPGGLAKNVKINFPGKYIISPGEKCKTFSNHGSGLELEIKFFESDTISSVSRTITDVYIKDGKTYICLDYSIPLNVKNGEIFCEKTKIYLSENYTGENSLNLSYGLFTSFTPNLRIPLLLKNSLSQEAIINKGFLTVDSEIQKIKDFLKIN